MASNAQARGPKGQKYYQNNNNNNYQRNEKDYNQVNRGGKKY